MSRVKVQASNVVLVQINQTEDEDYYVTFWFDQGNIKETHLTDAYGDIKRYKSVDSLIDALQWYEGEIQLSLF